MAPCSGGWWGDATEECTRTPANVTRYQMRISGLLLNLCWLHLLSARI
jgi:predicted ATPase with chaperone activity